MTAAPPSATAAPPRLQIEQSLEQLLQTLLELGICASDVQESALESSPGGVASGAPGGLIGRKAQQTIEQLGRLHDQKDLVANVNIPIEVINLVDQGKNPHIHTKNFIERLSGENMYTNGILSAVSDYRDLLRAQMGEAFPDLADALSTPASDLGPASSIAATNGGLPSTIAPGPSGLNGKIKAEDAR
ncbi:mediator of RNA polymerase II transcription subunit 10 [Rhodotorula toruloides]|uniref:Mediator of RNA polymerase II transcription subunit 10 n=1 Tax=Rhodotorula toruloides TaxID=5286 RepID=A0A511KDN6_RHOTO|nr:mediator of RNA polymerase II transcription subunit 10 [Rhodotorula toruloides]